jgi:hypothetical protein
MNCSSQMQSHSAQAIVAALARARRVHIALLCCLAAIFMVSCQEFQFGILVNETAGPISVTYTVPIRPVDPARTPYRCLLEPGQLRVARGISRSGTWPPKEGTRELPGVTIDVATCTASFRLEPSQAVGVFFNHYCADHATDRTTGGAAPKVPYFGVLSVTTGGRTRTWRDWAAVEQFERRRSGNCVFAVAPD